MFEDGVWRTIGGKRIFIKNGQKLSDAMKKSGKFKINEKINEKVVVVKNEINNSDDLMKSEEMMDKAKEIVKREKDIGCCDKVSKELVDYLKEQGIEAKVENVSVYFDKNDGAKVNGHYVISIDDKMYDYTGKQYLGGKDYNDVELRIYKNTFDNVYSQKDINIEKGQTSDEAIKNYLKNNQDEIVLIKDTNYKQENKFSNILNK